jgi:ring-1,2-phenylacetyl-CoA epoxidase subunit PaaE
MTATSLARPRAIDAPTMAMAAALVAGLVVSTFIAMSGRAPLWIPFVMSTVLLNCSFTVWHEAMHGNLAPGRRLNEMVGVVAAWMSLTPYFRIRQVHREHHAYTNDPVRDPDFWYLGGPFWTLPFRYLDGMRRYAKVDVSRAGRMIDRAGMAFAGVVVVAAVVTGHIAALVAAWLAPKAVSLAAHAWYVNYLPHHARPRGRFASARVFERVWWAPLVLFHNYHGLHHAYQTIPWHCYPAEFRRLRNVLVAEGTPVSATWRVSAHEAPRAAR